MPVQLRHCMPLAGFPIVRHLGQYKLTNSHGDQTYEGGLYEICGQVFRELSRNFPVIKPDERVSAGTELIAPLASCFQEQKRGVIVAVVLRTNQEKLGSKEFAVHDAVDATNESKFFACVDECIKEMLLQWQGTPVNASRDILQGLNQKHCRTWILAFEFELDAVRFAFGLQNNMMYTKKLQAFSQLVHPTEKGADGRCGTFNL